MDSRRVKVSGAGRAGGMLLASRPWRLPRWTTHIVASRTKKREETRRKERNRSTGRREIEEGKKWERMKGTRRKERSRGETFFALDRSSTSLNYPLRAPTGSSFLPSFLPSIWPSFLSPFLPSFLPFLPRSLLDRFVQARATIMHSLHGRPLRFMSLSPRQCVD